MKIKLVFAAATKIGDRVLSALGESDSALIAFSGAIATIIALCPETKVLFMWTAIAIFSVAVIRIFCESFASEFKRDGR